MRIGYEASNGRDRKADIRTRCKRLVIDLRAESLAEETQLAQLRQQMSDAVRQGLPVDVFASLESTDKTGADK